MDKIISFRVKALVVREDKFLVLHRTEAVENWWDLPGGGMEFGETAEETVIREVKEETGLFVTPIRLLDTWDWIRNNLHFTGVIFLCRYDGGQIQLSEEHDRYEWVELSANAVNDMYDIFKIKMINWDWDKIVV